MESYKKVNEHTYNLIAENYQNEHNAKVEWESELKSFVELLPQEKANVLDLGCGPGTEAIWISEHLLGGNIVAIDIAEKMLEKFSHLPENLSIAVADMITYVPDMRIDGIWARASIHHLTKTELNELFTNIKKYLNQDGIIFMINKYGTSEEIEEKEKYGSVIKRYFQYLDEELVEKLAFNTGFGVKRQYIVENDHKWLVSILVNK